MKSIFNPPLLAVEVEINSFCNRKCINCPNNNFVRPIAYLDENIFFKIINELVFINFNGRLTFNMFNEPLLDKRLPVFIEYAKTKMPSIFIYLNTNGDALCLASWSSLRRAGLDFAFVSQYDGKINDNINDVINHISDEERKHIFVRVFDIRKDVRNIAGLVNLNNNLNLPLKEICMRPFYQLCVNYQGKVVFCCFDYFGMMELGDLHKHSIMKIWQSMKLVYYRFMLTRKDRAHITLCKSCDNIEPIIPSSYKLAEDDCKLLT